VVLAALSLASGCAVGQRPGGGKVMYLSEQRTGGTYFLYLPDSYSKEVAAGRTLPLVMTFHGMKPFDTAGSQIREWQQEADRYGYVVCAPVLLTPDILSPIPLRSVSNSLRKDEEHILAVMDDLSKAASIDPNRVLATCWSYGGYIAHYMVNHHPERFACLVAKQSNFSDTLLDPYMVPLYRDYKVAVYYTENDLKLCREESKAAAVWYTRHGFDVKFAVFSDLGHERTPSLAAAFFAHIADVAPKTPPVELARLQVKDVSLGGTAVALGGAGAAPLAAGPPPPAGSGELVSNTSPLFADRRPGDRPVAPGARRADLPSGGEAEDYDPPRHSAALRTRPVPPPPSTGTAPPPTSRQSALDPENPLRVRVSSTIGISPLLVSFSATLPVAQQRGAFYLWTDNGEPICNGTHGQKFFTDPGTHRLEVLVTTADGEEHRAGQTITVLERIRSRSGT